ncbi:MAG: energy transducer TonB [Longimicrobiales bacterium]
MKDKSEHDRVSLPPDLAEVDAELSSISYEERPSFGPELEAELARAWRELPPPRAGSTARQLMAAGVAGLLMVALGVPSARASLVRWVDTLRPEQNLAAVPEAPAAVSPFFAEPLPEIPAEASSTFLSTAVPDGLAGEESLPPTYEGPEVTFPELADRAEAEAAILRAYPDPLQRAGMGGTVGVLLWVDEFGRVDLVNLGSSSGVAGLDAAALRVAPAFRFTPARRRGQAVATWVEFDVVFRPPPLGADDTELPEVAEVDPPVAPSFEVDVVPEWRGGVALPSPVQREAGELLSAALGDDPTIARLGSVDRILAGDAPSGMAPTAWRSAVADALEKAMVRDPDNPAPLLALGRLRRNQGLRTEARVLFERGLQRAMRDGGTASPTILAELHYERGSLIKQTWMGSRDLGRVPAEALPGDACAAARSSGGAASGYASVDRLVAWNYLCPAELRRVLTESFEFTTRDDGRDYAVMMGSFRSAVEAYPGHVGANIEILLGLADDGRWVEVLEGARRFVWASQGHPYGLLLSGMALQRMGRSEEADGQFRLALGGLPEVERDALEDVRALLPAPEADRYVRTMGAERVAWRNRFFEPLDPILSTEVNERATEHLARAVYAHLRFSGVDTDAGRIWVRYGRPDVIRVVGEGAGLRTEFWDYGEGPDVTFQRPATSVRMDLTPEARVYVRDLVSVYPHRYGAEARSVGPLEGQVVRTTGIDGTAELRIRTDVPTALATGAADSVDVGVFLLDEDGRTVSESRGRIPATERPLTLRVSAPAAARTLVVEIFNAAVGQAAVLRQDARAEATDGAASEGDIMLSATPPRPDSAVASTVRRESAED